MEVKTLFVTINSAMDLKAPRDDVYLVVSLSGDQKQRAPVNKKKGSTNPWSGHTFSFAVDEAAVLACCLKFEIKKAKGIIGLKKGIFCLKKGIGQVDVPLKDLLGEGGASDGKPKVMSRAVTSSSKETVSVLHFSYEFSQQFPIEVPSADEPVTGDPTAAAPSASNSAPSYPPPAPGVVQYTQLTDLANAALPAYAHPPAGHAARSFMGMLMVRFAVEALMSMLE